MMYFGIILMLFGFIGLIHALFMKGGDKHD